MTWWREITRGWRRLRCRHVRRSFVRNLHGDERNMWPKRQSMWRCCTCDQILLHRLPWGGRPDYIFRLDGREPT